MSNKTPMTSETRLADAEELFRLLIDAVEDYAIFVLSPEGIVQTWNLGANRLKGYTAQEVIGSHFSRFYLPADIERKHPQFELEQALEHGKYEEEGWRVRKEGTKFWANVVITTLRDGEGRLRGFGKVTRNLTERKQAQENLIAAYADLEKRIEERTRELRQAKLHADEAVKARERFFSIASHELKTPLASLRMQTQLRSRDIRRGKIAAFAPDKLAELCAQDERQIERLVFLVDNMFDISRLSSGVIDLKTEILDLSDLVNGVVQQLEPILETSNNSCTVELRSVRGAWDRYRIEQVVSNLLSNASKYAAGTRIEITVTGGESEATITIRDYGAGISQEDQERIFEPFQQGRRQEASVGGLGLGLFISRQIVEAHGGSIELESEVGQGATFLVKLPIRSESREDIDHV